VMGSLFVHRNLDPCKEANICPEATLQSTPSPCGHETANRLPGLCLGSRKLEDSTWRAGTSTFAGSIDRPELRIHPDDGRTEWTSPTLPTKKRSAPSYGLG
jgi:hypothetical protein